MSGYYGVTNPSIFSVREPATNVSHNLSTLQATIRTPDRSFLIDDNNGIVLTSDMLLGGCILRKHTTDWISDTTASASEIIDAFRRKYIAIGNRASFQNGTSFVCTFINDSDHWLVIVGGSGVNTGGENAVSPNETMNLLITITGQAALGGTDAVFISICNGTTPCFLGDSLVTLADGSMKAIRDVVVGEIVLGAFGEHNVVLALHRPVLGQNKMVEINEIHMTSDHHPHITADKKFVVVDPAPLSTTYGVEHPVFDEYGRVSMRHLDGLRADRIGTLQVGTILQTVAGPRPVETLRIVEDLPKTTQLFNLVVSGSHTYTVDGYAVTGWPSEADFDYDVWKVSA